MFINRFVLSSSDSILVGKSGFFKKYKAYRSANSKNLYHRNI